jgi:hypothetical protein
LRRRETIELVRAYYRIDDSALRRRLFELARAAEWVLLSAGHENLPKTLRSG